MIFAAVIFYILLISQQNLAKRQEIRYNRDMENELKTNAVKLSPDEQYQIRKSIVRLLKKGKAK